MPLTRPRRDGLERERAAACSLAWLALILVTLVTFAAGCLGPRAARPERGLLVHGGSIYPRIGAQVVEALYARAGLVVGLGTLAQLERRFDLGDCERIDLQGAVALPGFQDAHGHIEALGAGLERVDLSGLRDFDEVRVRLRAWSAHLPFGSWVLGEGWEPELAIDATASPREELTRACPNHPVFLRSRDGQAALLNRLALEIAGLSGPLDATALPDGWNVVGDAQGLASGLLIGEALRAVEPHIPPPARTERLRRLLAAQELLLAAGLTCVHDMGTDLAGLRLFAELRDAGRLKLRVASYLDLERPTSPLELAALPSFDDWRHRLRLRGGVLSADGSLAARSAALLDDYQDAAGERGRMRLERTQLVERVRWLFGAGLQPAVCASGDRATRLVLDAYEQALQEQPGSLDLRPRLECAQLVSAPDRERFAKLGVIPSMQANQELGLRHLWEARVGEARRTGLQAFEQLAGATAPLALGSAFPSQPTSVMAGVLSALDSSAARESSRAGTDLTSPTSELAPPAQLSIEAALLAYTEGAAFALGEERSRGRLEPGYACDMTVLDVDPHSAEDSALRAARVQMTIIDGELAFRLPELERAAAEAAAAAARALLQADD